MLREAEDCGFRVSGFQGLAPLLHGLGPGGVGVVGLRMSMTWAGSDLIRDVRWYLMQAFQRENLCAGVRHGHHLNSQLQVSTTLQLGPSEWPPETLNPKP